MGFDMHWREPDLSNRDAVAEAKAAFGEACRVRDGFPRGSVEAKAAQEVVHEAFEAMHVAETDYFRLNVWAMSRWVNAMRTLDMVCQPSESRDWPKIESYGVTWADVEAVDYPDDAESRSPELHERARKYVAERDRLLADHGGECPGIPEHKFGSNDGWIVTPAECLAALRILREHSAEVVLSALEDAGCDVGYWDQWVQYLVGAASHGGFEVN